MDIPGSPPNHPFEVRIFQYQDVSSINFPFWGTSQYCRKPLGDFRGRTYIAEVKSLLGVNPWFPEKCPLNQSIEQVKSMWIARFNEIMRLVMLIFEWLCFKEATSVFAYLLNIGWVTHEKD